MFEDIRAVPQKFLLYTQHRWHDSLEHQTGGGATFLKGLEKLIIWPYFCQKLHENERN